MKFKCLFALMMLSWFVVQPLRAQSTPETIAPILKRPIQATAVTAFEVQKFLMTRMRPLTTPTSTREWTAEAARLRKHILNDIAFHGWPKDWVNLPPRFEEAGVIETGHGYRLRKLRYEIVPGFWSTAILYEPENVHGKIPAILNVYGHWPEGKGGEFIQKRCINFAKRGIVALNEEWFGFGELSQPENGHDFGAHLDLVGANALGLFYLTMRRGLDYLASLPEVDSSRLGMTGLSGGGWQTIVFSALDPRVKVAVEVAGFSTLQTNITHPEDTDEVEENPTDFTDGEDYSDLVAMRAPRPTLLIHNAMDTCCFRAMLVKPYIYEAIKPFFELYGKPDALAWHENRDPGTHNYLLDNRQHAYAFFTRYFNLPVSEKEIPSYSEIKSDNELKVGVPADNLTVLGVARKLASEITRPPAAAEGSSEASTQREELKTIIRYKPVAIEHAWRMWNTKGMGMETLSYRLDFDNGLSATGNWLQGIAVQPSAPPVIVLDDNGRKATADLVSHLVNRGQQVLALNVIFNGEMRPQKPDPTDYELLISTTGERPLGLEVAQLIGAAQWLRQTSQNQKIRLETRGIRSQVVALTAAAIDPSLFSDVVTYGGMKSLNYLLSAPVPLRKAPELFCLDLYKDFDLNQLIALAQPVKINQFDRVGATSR
ncbi:MAG: alpha/beta hydrolase family protein [Terriglobia bacterium]